MPEEKKEGFKLEEVFNMFAEDMKFVEDAAKAAIQKGEAFRISIAFTENGPEIMTNVPKETLSKALLICSMAVKMGGAPEKLTIN